MGDRVKYKANPVVSCREEQEGSILFNPDTDDMQVINPSGRVIWDCIGTPRSVEEIMAYLAEVYEDMPAEQAAEDVQAFLERLLGDYVLQEGGGDDE
jgi:hypothetical protein